ncbi:MAG: hypothetical protein WBO12_17220, partial [Xanthobacteraceae bacterium]
MAATRGSAASKSFAALVGGAKERYLSTRSGRRDGADEWQMPDDVANSGLDLNDRKGRHLDHMGRHMGSDLGRHIDCRSDSCDMS